MQNTQVETSISSNSISSYAEPKNFSFFFLFVEQLSAKYVCSSCWQHHSAIASECVCVSRHQCHIQIPSPVSSAHRMYHLHISRMEIYECIAIVIRNDFIYILWHSRHDNKFVLRALSHSHTNIHPLAFRFSIRWSSVWNGATIWHCSYTKVVCLMTLHCMRAASSRWVYRESNEKCELLFTRFEYKILINHLWNSEMNDCVCAVWCLGS